MPGQAPQATTSTTPVAVLPYASPAAAGGHYADGAWREGNVLIVRKNVVLPPRCVKCGAPAEGPLMKRTFYWHEPILYILILAGILIYAIVALMVRKSGVVHVGLCAAHRRRRVILIGTSLALIFGGLGFAVLAGMSDMSELIPIGILMFIAGLIPALMSQFLRPQKIDDHFLWLKGCSPAFLDGLPALVRYR